MHARTVLVTSAVEREGKTTTAANLALAFARAGEHVILVDLDLRHPCLHRLFGAPAEPGVADVIAGGATLDAVLSPISIAHSGHIRATGDATASQRRVLELLPAGVARADPGDLLDSPSLRELLELLRERADLVVIDGPPMLPVADTMMLTRYVDTVLPVVRVGHTRRGSVVGLADALRSSSARTWGFVATDVPEDAHASLVTLGAAPRDESGDTAGAHHRSAA